MNFLHGSDAASPFMALSWCLTCVQEGKHIAHGVVVSGLCVLAAKVNAFRSPLCCQRERFWHMQLTEFCGGWPIP